MSRRQSIKVWIGRHRGYDGDPYCLSLAGPITVKDGLAFPDYDRDACYCYSVEQWHRHGFPRLQPGETREVRMIIMPIGNAGIVAKGRDRES